MSGMTSTDIEKVRITVSAAALDPKLVAIRKDLASHASRVFSDVGTQLHGAGWRWIEPDLGSGSPVVMQQSPQTNRLAVRLVKSAAWRRLFRWTTPFVSGVGLSDARSNGAKSHNGKSEMAELSNV